MNQLEDALRTTLHTRAEDITELPAQLIDAVERRPALPARRRPRWLPALAAATAVLLITAGVLLGAHYSRSTPPAHHTPSPTPTTIISPHAERSVSLSWFGMKALPTFNQLLWQSEIGYRALGVRGKSDAGIPVGCNGCEMASDYIRVFDNGVFDPARYHLSSWQRVTVSGVRGYLGTASEYGDPKYRVRSLAWQFAPRRWALVQGVTDFGSTKDALLSVANAVEPTVDIPLELPFRLDFIAHDLPITGITDDRAENYALVINFGTPTRSYDITLWKHIRLDGPLGKRVGGLPAYSGQGGVAVRYRGGVAIFGAINTDTLDEKINAADAVDTQRILDGVHWVNGDGRPPLIPAEQAIP